jgi:hypothetical protein
MKLYDWYRLMQQGYAPGDVWYSYDNGLNWTKTPRESADAIRLVVTEVDYERGIIVVASEPSGSTQE